MILFQQDVMHKTIAYNVLFHSYWHTEIPTTNGYAHQRFDFCDPVETSLTVTYAPAKQSWKKWTNKSFESIIKSWCNHIKQAHQKASVFVWYLQ